MTGSPRSKLPETPTTPLGSRLVPRASAAAAPSSTTSSPIAFTDPAEINREYIARLEDLFKAGCKVASATHDEALIAATQRLARELHLPREQYEFQMLLGVRDNLSSGLIAAGERVRIYVPYGDAWYAYSVRRLRENPSIAGYVARDVLRSFVPGM